MTIESDKYLSEMMIRYNKLLEFVRYVANYDETLNNRFWRKTKGYSIMKAREVLKEIGEIDD